MSARFGKTDVKLVGWPPRWPDGTEAAQALAGEVARGCGAATEPPVGVRTRAWSGIEERRRRGAWASPSLRVALALAGAGAAVVLALVARAPSPAASLAGTRFDGGAARRIDVHGAAQVALEDGTRGAVAQDDRRGIALAVERGSVLADVEHRPAGAPFLVRTPAQTVRVVGTVFWVDVDDAGRTTVLVGRGAVEVLGGDGSVIARVAAGERWPARSIRQPPPQQLLLLRDRIDGARFAPPAAPAGVEETGRAPTGAGSGAAPSGECAGLAGAAAVSCFRQLVASGDPLRAESALYEMGWRELRDLGDARGALATWTSQRRRFPSGALRSEADRSIIQAAVKLDDRRRARREAEAWLSSHPAGIAAPEVRFLLGSVERADGRCGRAIADFDAALKGQPAAAWAGEARKQRAACARTDGP
jgi:hypothetical protein